MCFIETAEFCWILLIRSHGRTHTQFGTSCFCCFVVLLSTLSVFKHAICCFLSFLLPPQAMTFPALCKWISPHAQKKVEKTEKRQKNKSVTAWAVVSDATVTDGSLVFAWENNCEKENNPSFQNVPSSPCLFLIFPPSSPHYSHKSVT